MTSQWRHRNRTHNRYTVLNPLQNEHFGIFRIMKINRITLFCNLFMERPSYDDMKYTSTCDGSSMWFPAVIVRSSEIYLPNNLYINLKNWKSCSVTYCIMTMSSIQSMLHFSHRVSSLSMSTLHSDNVTECSLIRQPYVATGSYWVQWNRINSVQSSTVISVILSECGCF